jgi:hypothetical protein
MIYVTNRADIYVRLVSLKFFFGHDLLSRDSCLNKKTKIVFYRFRYRPYNWSPHPDLNRGPLPYQGSALPLSYVGNSHSVEPSFPNGAGDGDRTHIISLEG